MQIFTPRLLLREFRPTDVDALLAIKGDAETVRYENAPFTLEQTQQLLQWTLQEQGDTPRMRYRLAVTIPPDDTLRGWISLRLNNSDIHEYEMGWSIHKDFWNRGYATEAARAVMRYAFTERGAHRVIAFCHAENLPSARVMEKLGMQREGHLRRVRWLNNAWCDELVYAILEQEFEG